MKELQIKKYYELEEVQENNGCIMVWIDNKDGSYSFARSNAWRDLASVTLNKYIHKVEWIKRFKYEYDYSGVRQITVKEENGTRYFYYIR
jgi:hypothetical protein